MTFTFETPKKCPRQARRAYAYEPTDFHFERRTPKSWGHVYFTPERKRCALEVAVAVVLTIVFAVSVAFVVTLK